MFLTTNMAAVTSLANQQYEIPSGNCFLSFSWRFLSCYSINLANISSIHKRFKQMHRDTAPLNSEVSLFFPSHQGNTSTRGHGTNLVVGTSVRRVLVTFCFRLKSQLWFTERQCQHLVDYENEIPSAPVLCGDRSAGKPRASAEKTRASLAGPQGVQGDLF